MPHPCALLARCLAVDLLVHAPHRTIRVPHVQLSVGRLEDDRPVLCASLDRDENAPERIQWRPLIDPHSGIVFRVIFHV